MYSKSVLQHFYQPHNVAQSGVPPHDFVAACVHSPSGSDVIKLQICVKNAMITHAEFNALGNVATVAAGSLVTGWLRGKSLEAASNILSTDIAAELSLPNSRIYCAILAEDAIKAVIQAFRNQ